MGFGGTKGMDPWPDIDTEQQSSVQQICYKYRNTSLTSDCNEQAGARWWRDTSAINASSQLDYQQQSHSNYNLIDSESSDLLQDNENSTKKSLKSKQQRQTVLKECRESLKRTKHPERWKVNVKKNARLKGEEYIGVGGKLVPAKTMGPPCKCRMRCSEKIDKAAREELHNVFWKTCTWEQRKQYVALSVKESPKQRTRCRGNAKSEHRRQITFTYSLLLKGEFITVCKCMFLSTFALSEKFVRHAMDKKRTSPGGIIGPDQRGRHTPKTKKSEQVKDRVREHIQSFPTEKSRNPKDRLGRRYLDSKLNIATMHKMYVSKCREEGVAEGDIVKESYYREMFKTEFNLGFKREKIKHKKHGNEKTLDEPN